MFMSVPAIVSVNLRLGLSAVATVVGAIPNEQVQLDTKHGPSVQSCFCVACISRIEIFHKENLKHPYEINYRNSRSVSRIHTYLIIGGLFPLRSRRTLEPTQVTE